MPTKNLKDFVTVSRAAEILGVSSGTLRNWDRSGKLRAKKHPFSGYRLYRKVDLNKLLKKLNSNR